MRDIYRFHDNLKKIMAEDTVDRALEKYEGLSEKTKALLGIIAFELKESKDGDISVKMPTEDLQRMLMFINTKNSNSYHNKPINDEETEILGRVIPKEQIRELFKT